MTSSEMINPATEEVLRTVEQTDEAGVDDAVARAKAAQRDWARLAPAERAAALARLRRGGRRARRRTGGAGGGQLRPPDRQRRVGSRPRPRCAAVLLRQPGTVVRQADSGRRRPGRHVQRAAWRRRRHHAVELPDDDRLVGLRARAGRRQRGAGQTGGVDAADHDPARRARRRGRAARGPVPGAARQGVGGGGAVRHPPRRPQDRVHRVHRGRHAR